MRRAAEKARSSSATCWSGRTAWGVATAVTVFGFGVPLRGSFLLLVGLTALFVLSTIASLRFRKRLD